MINLGDFPSQQTVYLMTNAHKGDGTPIDGAGGLAVSVYKDDNTTEYASGTDITLTGPFDSRTGFISVKVVTTNAFFAAGHDYFIVVTTGTVDSISVVSYVLAAFSIENRAAPTLASIVAGIWGALLTAISTTGSIGKLIKDYLDAAISSRSTYAGGAVASVTAGVTVATNNDKGGYSLSTAPPTAADIKTAIEGSEVLAKVADLPGEAPTVEAIDAQLSGVHGSGAWGASGAGSSSLDVTVTSSGEPVEGIMVEVYTSSAKTGFIRKTTTNGSGLAHFDINPGTYYVWVLHSDYTGTNPTEVTVT